ncbi:putative protein 1 [Haloarcula hispanica icosahedral virus 2]|uniref:Uncharacterized protein n=1 Tax=Haloarcula hispanica icosahedral virus 2 TaxID=1154689 RepID=H9AZV7_9VIRU|nr:putative protein 1 [Haloarcula hispanica icosahedral virus 2]AFD02282.1 putative protein 1 [Haloarcula hispanica icosahedral virus 2]
MPGVSRLSGTATTAEGFAIETSSGGTDYRYVLRVTEHREVPDEGDPTPGTVEVTERYKNGEEVEPEATEVVARTMDEYGYEVEA